MSASVVPFRSANAYANDGPEIEAEAEYPRDLDELHARMVRWFEETERASEEARDLANLARDYYDGRQWTAEEEKILKARGQPILTVNYVKRKVQLLCGMERKARTDPKAFPRDPTEDEKADAATQALRYIADDNKLSVTRSAVYENILVEGFGGVEIGLKDDGKGGADVTITQVPWERVWYDPHSRASDFSDCRYKGLVIWMDRDQLEDLYPDAGDVVGDAASAGGFSSYDDRPGSVVWTDNQRQRTRVLVCHWLEGKTWWECTFARGGILVSPRKSKFRNSDGDSECRLILQSAYIDRENRRYGMVRDLLSLQDELNKRRSKALHLLSVHQAITEEGAVADMDATRRELAKPDGVIVVNPNMRFEIVPGGDLAQGQFKLLQHATMEMEASGPNASMSGTDSKELSGRAILAQQAGGAAQHEPLADGLRQWTRRVMEMSWMAAREFWTAGRWVRVTDDLGSIRWVGINEQVTMKQALAEMDEGRRAMIMQRMQLMPGDPRLDQVVETRNDISDLDVDIVVEEGIDVPAQAAENFQTLIQLAGMQPGLIPADVLIAASSLKGKDDLLKRMKEHQEQAAQKAAEQEPLMRAHAVAEVQGKQAKAKADEALARERNAATARSVHDIHAEFSAPPYGAPFSTPPDAASPANEPEMSPGMKLAHQIAELRGKHRTADVSEATVVQRLAQAHAAMRPPPAKGPSK